WDILFFAGHSNETSLTGGEFAIAPGNSLLLQEIEGSLIIAKERGLQFAIFNSCNGMSIANRLIDLGLSQVAVMREPIHNQVAQEFLLRFLASLAEYKDVGESLLSACQYLKLEKHLTYPSAYLIPSLFCHPHAPLFRIKPFGNKERLKHLLPRKKEAIALAIFIATSWQLPVQDILLEQRVLTQARYRQFTHQLPEAKQPPVLLVQIDEESIKKAGIYDPKPMNRRYLAQLVDKLTALDAKVVGIDYLLDRYQKENDPYLAQAIQTSITKNQTWFVFGITRKDGGGWFNLLPDFANKNWSLQGDVMLLFAQRISHVTLVPRKSTDPRNLPFAYLLSLAYWSNFVSDNQPPQPQLPSSVNWLSQIKTYINEETDEDYKNLFSSTARLQNITNFAYQYNQRWLHPILDFSIPPNRVYQRLPAWQLLDTRPDTLKLNLTQNGEQKRIKKQPIIIIAPGGYGEAGVAAEGEDNFPVPGGLRYWRDRENPPDLRQLFPGSEVHAYLIHHFLTQRLVVPIPDLWLVGVAALLGKLIVLNWKQGTEARQKKSERLWGFIVPLGNRKSFLLMVAATGFYGLVSLQLYITGALLLPFAIPVTTFWTYLVLDLFTQ
ncbi:MAG TPA: histidine kinase, partial [Cyanobacteria bacterium UBA11166]|nr:histidine kinase [Cyanobacteria bacterium UBA11166]